MAGGKLFVSSLGETGKSISNLEGIGECDRGKKIRVKKGPHRRGSVASMEGTMRITLGSEGHRRFECRRVWGRTRIFYASTIGGGLRETEVEKEEICVLITSCCDAGFIDRVWFGYEDKAGMYRGW